MDWTTESGDASQANKSTPKKSKFLQYLKDNNQSKNPSSFASTSTSSYETFATKRGCKRGSEMSEASQGKRSKLCENEQTSTSSGKVRKRIGWP